MYINIDFYKRFFIHSSTYVCIRICKCIYVNIHMCKHLYISIYLDYAYISYMSS